MCQERAVRQGVPRRRGRQSHCLGADRLAHVDAIRTRLLRDRDDADGDAAL